LSENVLKVWKAWKQFPEWWNKYWKHNDSEKVIAEDAWTKGVIYPFIVTAVGPQLECRMELEEGKRDFTLYKGKKMLAHIEHENNIEKVYGEELPKLVKSKAKLKVIISYGTQENIEHYLNFWMSSRIDNLKREGRFNEEWLLIFGIYNQQSGWMEKNSDWIGFLIYWKEKQVRKEKLK